MTDKEILEAVQNCANGCVKKCPYDEYTLDYEKCMSDLMEDALSLLNRQNAEIERLKNGYGKLLADAWKRVEELDKLNETARVNAIKELAERLVAEKYYTGNPAGYGTYAVMVDTINKIAEKMMEGNNG